MWGLLYPPFAGSLQQQLDMQCRGGYGCEPSNDACTCHALTPARLPSRRCRWYPTATRLPDGRVVIVGGSDSPNRPGGNQSIRPPQAEIWDNLAPNSAPINVSYPSSWSMSWIGPGYYPYIAVIPKGAREFCKGCMRMLQVWNK